MKMKLQDAVVERSMSMIEILNKKRVEANAAKLREIRAAKEQQ